MNLTDEEIRNKIRNPENGKLIESAIADELWLNCLCNGSNKDLFLARCKSFFVPELAGNIESSFDIHSKSFLSIKDGTVYSHFNKINYSIEGKSENIEFTDKREKVAYLEYVQNAYLDKKSNWNFFDETILDLVLYNPNARLIADFRDSNSNETLPTIQIAYISQIHDISEDVNGIKYIIVKKTYGKYRGGTEYVEVPPTYTANMSSGVGIQRAYPRDFIPEYNLYYVYDSVKYAIYKSNVNSNDATLESYFEHNFGETPARSVSSYSKDNIDRITKKSPITTSMDDIFNYNFIKNVAKFFHWQNASPISFRINKTCKETNGEAAIPCDGGYFKMPVELDSAGDLGGKRRFRMIRCQACERAAREKMTFGQSIAINHEDLIKNPEMVDLIKKGFSYTEMNTGLMTFNYTMLESFEQKLIDVITGEGFNSEHSKEAFNEKQIILSTDDKQGNLSTFASSIERLQEWADGFIAKTRFFTFQSIRVDFGRTFFFKGKDEIYRTLEMVRKSSGNAFLEYSNIRQAAITENRFMPENMRVFDVFTSILPLQSLTNDQVLSHAQTLVAIGISPNDIKRRIESPQIIALFKLIYEDQYKAKDKSTIAMASDAKRFVDRYFPAMELQEIESDETDPDNANEEPDEETDTNE